MSVTAPTPDPDWMRGLRRLARTWRRWLQRWQRRRRAQRGDGSAIPDALWNPVVAALPPLLQQPQAGRQVGRCLEARPTQQQHEQQSHTHGWLVALASLMGGLLLMVADLLARGLVAPQEIPVGVLTAVLGGGYLLWLMHRRTG